MYQAGLVLEGGGMKGVYTTGVLDYFLEKGLSFSCCYGVSAGAIHMCNFLAGNKERGLRTSVNYLNDRHYCGLYSLLTTGDYFGVDFCYRKIPTELEPFDNDTFRRQKTKAYAVITNIVTGKPEYYQIKDIYKDMLAIRASSSLPLLSRNVIIDGKPYLDGGLSDSIPLGKSIEDGNVKNVVILTKEEGYVRQPSSMLLPMKLKYRKYPKVYENMKRRHRVYNRSMRLVQQEKEAGRAFVIQPCEALDIGRVEKDADKLRQIYRIGYEDGKRAYDELIAFLA
ncbi:MAG: patatin family protein [Lachnospiraceae bacterium]|nr:patatin family protein [Lachnospiraceae bacterium]